MFFSIIVPVYNVQDYLLRCLDSIDKQNYKDYELILVDDGSTDQSSSLCDEFAKNRNNVIVIHQKNGGLSSARNAGMAVSKGEYIVFVDSDDWIADSTLDKFHGILECDKVDLLFARAVAIDENGNTKDKLNYCIPSGKYTIDEYFAQLEKLQCYSACAPFTICKRSLLLDNNITFKDKLIHEDELWTPTILLKAKNVYVSDFYFYYHFYRANSINNSTKSNISGQNLYIVCKELEHLFAGVQKDYAKVLREQMVVLYFQAICLVDDYTAIPMDAKFVRENAFSTRTKLKALLYSISPKLYVKTHRAYRGED